MWYRTECSPLKVWSQCEVRAKSDLVFNFRDDMRGGLFLPVSLRHIKSSASGDWTPILAATQKSVDIGRSDRGLFAASVLKFTVGPNG